CADQHRVPAGQALAGERFGFAPAITQRLALPPRGPVRRRPPPEAPPTRRARIERRRLDELPDGPVIVCTGPLTEGALGEVIRAELGGDRMYFYDAIAPIVAADSIDWDFAFRASRWGRDADAAPHDDHDRPAGGDTGVGDYVNCPLSKAQYEDFV